MWHCPKTNGTQHILHSSSHIVDTNTRQGGPWPFPLQLSGIDFPKSKGLQLWTSKICISTVLYQAVHCTVVQQVLPGVRASKKTKDSLESENPKLCPAVLRSPRQSGQLVDTHDPLSTRPLGACQQHLTQLHMKHMIKHSCV